MVTKMRSGFCLHNDGIATNSAPVLPANNLTMSHKKKTAVVTGAAGFLGSHLTDRLLKEGYKVIGIDNLLTGNVHNIEHLAGKGNYRFINHDVTEFIYLPGDVHLVFHFASPASPIDYLKLPIETLKVGSIGTHHALGLAKAKGATFLLASTSETYGDPLEHPQKETYWGNVNPIGLRGVYDEAKRFAEALVMAYHRTHDMDTKIVRIFNTYGPRMRLEDGRVVPAFIGQALAGEPLTRMPSMATSTSPADIPALLARWKALGAGASGQLAANLATGHEAGVLFMLSNLDSQFDSGLSSFDARGERDVLERGELGHQLVVLKDEAHAASERGAWRHEAGAGRKDADLALVGLIEAAELLEERRLA